MKFGIEFDTVLKIPYTEQAKMIKEHGFDATFIGLEAENLGEIVDALHQYDIEIESCHAPFDGINNMWLAGEAGDRMYERLTNSIDACAKYNIPVVVVHLSSGMTPPRMNDIGFERYDRLMQYAREKGVIVAYENIRKLDNVAYMMENYPDAGFCWDVGHEACYMNGMEFMPLFGKRMVAIHFHDNTGIYDEDKHWLPYDGVIDMDRAARHFAKSGYQKSLMLEVHQRSAGIPCLEEFYNRAQAAANRFAERVEYFRGLEAEAK